MNVSNIKRGSSNMDSYSFWLNTSLGPELEEPIWYYDEDYPDRPPPPPGPPPGAPPDGPPVNYDHPKTIHFVCVGIIIPIGLVLNTLAIVVFVHAKSLRRTTTGLYLIALAVADNLFLAGEFVRWLNTPDLMHLGWHVDFLDRIDALCKIIMWLRYGSKLASAWLTVVVTVERFLTVAFPLKVSRYSTPRNAKITICIVVLLSFLCGAFPFWTVGVFNFDGWLMCIVLLDKKHVYDICNWVFLRAGSLFIPGVLIAIFCILIYVNLKSASTVRQRKLSISSSTGSGSRNPTAKLERQLSTMLIAVTVAFLALRLPYTITYWIHFYAESIYGVPVPHDTSLELFYALKITDVFATLNYATNFFLYCLSGSSFRKHLRALCRCSERGRFDSRSSSRTGGSFGYNRSASVSNDYSRQISTTSQVPIINAEDRL